MTSVSARTTEGFLEVLFLGFQSMKELYDSWFHLVIYFLSSLCISEEDCTARGCIWWFYCDGFIFQLSRVLRRNAWIMYLMVLCWCLMVLFPDRQCTAEEDYTGSWLYLMVLYVMVLSSRPAVYRGRDCMTDGFVRWFYLVVLPDGFTWWFYPMVLPDGLTWCFFLTGKQCITEEDCTAHGWDLVGSACGVHTVTGAVPDVFLLCCFLFIGTFTIAYAIRSFRQSIYFPSIVSTSWTSSLSFDQKMFPFYWWRFERQTNLWQHIKFQFPKKNEQYFA